MVAILLETVNETSRKWNDLHRRELKTHSSLFSAPSSSFSFSFSTFISFFLSLSLSLSFFLFLLLSGSVFICFCPIPSIRVASQNAIGQEESLHMELLERIKLDSLFLLFLLFLSPSFSSSFSSYAPPTIITWKTSQVVEKIIIRNSHSTLSNQLEAGDDQVRGRGGGNISQISVQFKLKCPPILGIENIRPMWQRWANVEMETVNR